MRLFQNTVFRIKKLNKDPPVISGVADWRRAQLNIVLNCLPCKLQNLKQHIKEDDHSFPERGIYHDLPTSSTQRD